MKGGPRGNVLHFNKKEANIKITEGGGQRVRKPKPRGGENTSKKKPLEGKKGKVAGTAG